MLIIDRTNHELVAIINLVILNGSHHVNCFIVYILNSDENVCYPLLNPWYNVNTQTID